MREEISAALKKAQKEQDKRRTSTLRLVTAAINDHDIALHGKGKDKAGDEEIIDILTRMVKQREESARLYHESGRSELETQELDEIKIIQDFLPSQLSDDETAKVVDDLIQETGASSLRDMGKVMGLLKERYRGQIDMGKAGAMIKSRIG